MTDMVARVVTPSSQASTRTLFVPCAGLGSRLASRGHQLPKPLAEVGGIPALARVILSYPQDWDIVVALGYQADFVQEGIEVLFSDSPRLEKLKFLYTPSFKTPGQGLSHTILAASKILKQRPFVFHAVDAILTGPENQVPDWILDQNQILLAKPSSPGNYRFPQKDKFGRVGWNKRDFVSGDISMAYTGIAHVNRPTEFFERLRALADSDPDAGETLGLDLATSASVELVGRRWLDVGTMEGLDAARRYFNKRDNILPKSDESIWFYNSNVIKVHMSPDFIQGRVERSRVLTPHVPRVKASSQHTYTYGEAPGRDLSLALRDPEFDLEKFFDFLWSFWSGSAGSKPFLHSNVADESYLVFYRDKTAARVRDLVRRFPRMDEDAVVDGQHVGPASQLLAKIPWDYLATICPATVHGDLHAENILETGKDQFLLLDWRQDLAGSRGATGDLYYDLGKLAHGFRVDHRTIAKGRFSAQTTDDGTITLHLEMAERKQEALDLLEERVRDRGLSWDKVLLMEAVIYLNIASLHSPDRYAEFLGYLGRTRAQEVISSLETGSQPSHLHGWE
nr:hypothetical protein [Pontimonas sp.]